MQTVSTGMKSFSEITEFPMSCFYSFHSLEIVLDRLKVLDIGEECFNNVQCDLEICNYPILQKIIVRKNSLQNLNSLKICNNESLHSIEIEDGQRWSTNELFFVNGAFFNVNTVVFESMNIIMNGK